MHEVIIFTKIACHVLMLFTHFYVVPFTLFQEMRCANAKLSDSEHRIESKDMISNHGLLFSMALLRVLDTCFLHASRTWRLHGENSCLYLIPCYSIKVNILHNINVVHQQQHFTFTQQYLQ
jgi:hypothetical protein